MQLLIRCERLIDIEGFLGRNDVGDKISERPMPEMLKWADIFEFIIGGFYH
jgi:hypothetical protein